MHLAEAVRGRARSGAGGSFPMLVKCAEHALETFPGIIVEHSGGRTTPSHFAKPRPIQTSAEAVRHGNIDTSSSSRHSILTRVFTFSFSILARSIFVLSSRSSLATERPG